MQINPGLLSMLRLMLGLIWLYNGLWLKILAVDPEHQAVVSSLNLGGLIQPQTALRLIGGGETILALAIWSGFFNRFVSWFQFGLLIAMNAIGILFTNAIAQPVHLIMQNLPMLFCIIILALYGSKTKKPQRKLKIFVPWWFFILRL